MTTIEKYEKSVMQVIDEFCKKQDCDFEYWVGDIVGEICVFGDNFFNFTDVYLDLINKAPAGLIFEWQNSDIEFNINRKKPKHINYRSYIMGARFKMYDKKATFEWLYEKGYIDLNGADINNISNIEIDAINKNRIELKFAFNHSVSNIIYNPTKKEVKKAIHLFGTSVITEL